MKIEVVEASEDELEFVLKDATIPFVNAIRRIAMSQIPVFAIDTVTFYENNSAMFDEYIANRLALLPLKTEDGYKEGDEILFSLNEEGPCTVYSKDLKSHDKKIKCVHDKIPIMKLLEGQTLRLEAKARLGIGMEHAKFQTGVASYKYDPKDKETFTFKFESFGQMSAKKIITKAAEILEKKCKELNLQLEEI